MSVFIVLLSFNRTIKITQEQPDDLLPDAFLVPVIDGLRIEIKLRRIDDCIIVCHQ